MKQHKTLVIDIYHPTKLVLRTDDTTVEIYLKACIKERTAATVGLPDGREFVFSAEFLASCLMAFSVVNHLSEDD